MIARFARPFLHASLALVPLLVACRSSGPSPDSAAQESRGPGAECVARAGAERTVPEGAPERIGVAHILIHHKELARPKGATRTREEACLRALEARSALEEGQDWNSVVETFSDSGKSTHGDLGMVRREELNQEFANAAFGLEIDELSYVVESDRGFHIIARTE